MTSSGSATGGSITADRAVHRGQPGRAATRCGRRAWTTPTRSGSWSSRSSPPRCPGDMGRDRETTSGSPTRRPERDGTDHRHPVPARVCIGSCSSTGGRNSRRGGRFLQNRTYFAQLDGNVLSGPTQVTSELAFSASIDGDRMSGVARDDGVAPIHHPLELPARTRCEWILRRDPGPVSPAGCRPVRRSDLPSCSDSDGRTHCDPIASGRRGRRSGRCSPRPRRQASAQRLGAAGAGCARPGRNRSV